MIVNIDAISPGRGVLPTQEKYLDSYAITKSQGSLVTGRKDGTITGIHYNIKLYQKLLRADQEEVSKFSSSTHFPLFLDCVPNISFLVLVQ